MKPFPTLDPSDSTSDRLIAEESRDLHPHLNPPSQSDHLKTLESRRQSQKSLKGSFRAGSILYLDDYEHGTLGTWGTVLAILSTVVGGGLVGIPFGFY